MNGAWASGGRSHYWTDGSRCWTDGSRCWTCHEGINTFTRSLLTCSPHGNTLTLDNVAGAPAIGVSYEAYDIGFPIAAGDVISFEYKGACGGGAPRVFVMGGLWNSWDAYQDCAHRSRAAGIASAIPSRAHPVTSATSGS